MSSTEERQQDSDSADRSGGAASGSPQFLNASAYRGLDVLIGVAGPGPGGPCGCRELQGPRGCWLLCGAWGRTGAPGSAGARRARGSRADTAPTAAEAETGPPRAALPDGTAGTPGAGPSLPGLPKRSRAGSSARSPAHPPPQPGKAAEPPLLGPKWSRRRLSSPCRGLLLPAPPGAGTGGQLQPRAGAERSQTLPVPGTPARAAPGPPAIPGAAFPGGVWPCGPAHGSGPRRVRAGQGRPGGSAGVCDTGYRQQGESPCTQRNVRLNDRKVPREAPLPAGVCSLTGFSSFWLFPALWPRPGRRS